MDYSSSLTYIDLYLNDVELSAKDKKFFTCLKTIIKFKRGNIDEKYLNSLYSTQYLNLCKSFLENRNYLNYIEYSSCFDCESCKTKGTCKLFDTLLLAEKIERIYIENIPNQQKLSEVFVY